MAKAKKKKGQRAPAASTGAVSVVPIGTKICKPFLLEVMVFSPEAGFKFKVVVERSCTPDADAIWKLVFDLFQVADGNEVQVVHVSYTTQSAVESKNVQLMASQGVKPSQAKVLVDEVHPAAKDVIGAQNPTPAQKAAVLTSISNAINA
jgi:hypothetical protein